MDTRAKELMDYWLGLGPEGWFRVDPAVDDAIRARWEGLWQQGRAGALAQWAATPEGCLALLILLDQLPRNMFRGEARAFASDGRALAVATSALLRGRDARVPPPERQFFYLPLMHSEVQANQDRCVRLALLSSGLGEGLRHARAHREIIRRFGRFPYRNAALGRQSTPEEVAFLEEGGYQKMLDAIAA
jgi:uncharacterized protein (DUF924 family)